MICDTLLDLAVESTGRFSVHATLPSYPFTHTNGTSFLLERSREDGHGSPVAAATIGSVAQAVAREAPCPILIVPAAGLAGLPVLHSVA